MGTREAGEVEHERRRKHRESVVREHMASENELRFDDTLATFAHPRYELIGTNQVYDGPDAVRGYWQASRSVFPDQRNEIRSLRHSEDAVIVEFALFGTHLGSLSGEEPSGKAFRCEMVAIFEFGPGTAGGGPRSDEYDLIACERVYFDSGTIYQQLT